MRFKLNSITPAGLALMGYSLIDFEKTSIFLKFFLTERILFFKK